MPSPTKRAVISLGLPLPSRVDRTAPTFGVRGWRTCVVGDAIVANHPNGSDGAGVALLVFVDAGLAEPEVSAAVHVAGGGWLLEGDLVWRAERRQWSHDRDRRARVATGSAPHSTSARSPSSFCPRPTAFEFGADSPGVVGHRYRASLS